MDAMIMRYQKYDKRINIWLAIVSSSSIAAWTVWHIVPQLWAGIIAVTQVGNTSGQAILSIFKIYKDIE